MGTSIAVTDAKTVESHTILGLSSTPTELSTTEFTAKETNQTEFSSIYPLSPITQPSERSEIEFAMDTSSMSTDYYSSKFTSTERISRNTDASGSVKSSRSVPLGDSTATTITTSQEDESIKASEDHKSVPMRAVLTRATECDEVIEGSSLSTTMPPMPSTPPSMSSTSSAALSSLESTESSLTLSSIQLANRQASSCFETSEGPYLSEESIQLVPSKSPTFSGVNQTKDEELADSKTERIENGNERRRFAGSRKQTNSTSLQSSTYSHRCGEMSPGKLKIELFLKC